MNTKMLIFSLVICGLLYSCCPNNDTEPSTTDTIYKDITCYPCIDSALTANIATLDSLHELAMQEVTDYREQSIIQVDEMRVEFIQWKDSTLKLMANNNMLVLPDTSRKVDYVGFGEDGKPIIRFK